jgi:hypothetical protein
MVAVARLVKALSCRVRAILLLVNFIVRNGILSYAYVLFSKTNFEFVFFFIRDRFELI